MNNCKLKIKMITLMMMVVLFVGCQDKPSSIGFGNSRFDNFEHRIDLNEEIVTKLVTFDDQLYNVNSKLIVGEYRGVEARVLLRFIGLPRNVKLTEDPQILLNVNRNETNKINDNTMRMVVAPLVDNVFMPLQTNWNRANDADPWKKEGGDFDMERAVRIEFSMATAESDTLSFTICRELVQDWIDTEPLPASETKNFGLIIFAEDAKDNLLEFVNVFELASISPRMVLTYHLATNEEDNTQSETVRARTVAFIHNGIDKNGNEERNDWLGFSNILPRSMYVKFDLTYDMFEGKGILNENDLRYVNINRAFLVFSVNEDDTQIFDKRFTGNVDIWFRSGVLRGEHGGEPDGLNKPFNEIVYTQRINNIDPISAPRNTTMKDNELFIDITNPLQFILSEVFENNGIVMRNNNINLDFSHVTLYGLDAEEELRPRLIINYSVQK